MRFPKKRGKIGSSRQGRIFLTTPEGDSYGVHETVAYIWEQADGRKTIPEIGDQLVKELEIHPNFQQEEKDNVTLAIRSLQKKNLIKFTESK